MGGHPFSAAELHFLGAIALPENASRSEMALYIGDEAGLDPGLLKILLNRQPPQILGSGPAGAMRAGAAAIRRIGGDAFACSLADIEALGPTLKARELELDAGRLVIPLWRLETATISLGDIVLLVRSTLTTTTVRITSVPRHLRPLTRGVLLTQSGAPSYESRTTVSEKLDIHVRDGRVFQIDGDKFGYAILGAGRTQGDMSNMDRMFDMLRHFAPHAVADDFYRLWAPPPEILRFRIAMMRINNDDPAFAFYSRWIALMYRAMGVIAPP